MTDDELKQLHTDQKILRDGAQDALCALREVLLALGEKTLGAPTPKESKALDAIADPKRLEALALALLAGSNAKTWSEFLGLPAPRRSRPK